MNSVAPPNADLLRQLADIRGLRPVSWWPLAPGWWALLALLLLVGGIAIAFILRRRAWHRSWQGAAARQLTKLEAQLTAETAQATAADLSLLLRRIAIRRFARSECAGLEGQRWLRWLKNHDPRDFDWPTAGKGLIEAPYAPSTDIQPLALRELLHAARRWVA